MSVLQVSSSRVQSTLMSVSPLAGVRFELHKTRMFPDYQFCMIKVIYISYLVRVIHIYEFPQWLNSKESTCNEGNTGDKGSIPGLGRFPRRRKWQPTPVFLPGKSRGQRSLVGYSLECLKESDTAKPLSTVQYTHICAKAAHCAWCTDSPKWG